MTLYNRISNERSAREHFPNGAPFTHEAAGWHVLDITLGEADVLRIFEGLFSIHEQGFISDRELIEELNVVTRKKDNVLWRNSFPHSDEGPAANFLEDIGYCRSLDPRWVTRQLVEGQGDDVLELARHQATARVLAERFVPIWVQVAGDDDGFF